jgi:transposase-like protein
MTISSNPYRGFRFPREVIEHAVWLYHCFSLSLRDVELILAARGIVVSYEMLRDRRDEKRASIRMRNCRRMRDERWAQPD